mmetsp:Transcript_88574/g.228401  ORF Transcript_88574/g.228401 Transcript_88574/m.228401 type:complete len:295 (+) Transcript_88574:550-1434(+)
MHARGCMASLGQHVRRGLRRLAKGRRANLAWRGPGQAGSRRFSYPPEPVRGRRGVEALEWLGRRLAARRQQQHRGLLALLHRLACRVRRLRSVDQRLPHRGRCRGRRGRGGGVRCEAGEDHRHLVPKKPHGPLNLGALFEEELLLCIDLSSPLRLLGLQLRHLDGELLQPALLALHLHLHGGGEAVHRILHDLHGRTSVHGILAGRLVRGALSLAAQPAQLLQLAIALRRALLGLCDAVLGPEAQGDLLLLQLPVEGLLHPIADDLAGLRSTAGHLLLGQHRCIHRHLAGSLLL